MNATFHMPLVAATMLFFAAPAAYAQVMPIPNGMQPPRTISVSGEGLIRVTPDVATLRFGVVTVDADPRLARQRNAEDAAAAMNAARALGIPEKNIRLESLRLNQRQDWNPDLRRSEDKGFEAVRDVVVRLDEMDKLPELVAQVVEKGANRLQGIEYDVKDRDGARAQALKEAVQAARAKAELLASAASISIGPVMQISETAYDFPRPFMRMETAMYAKADMAGSEAVPDAYAAGEIEVRATVQVVYGIQ